MHIDEVRNNQFFQFPQWILKEPYNALSDKAKLMYMLLFDRRTLSEKNNWYDENGRVYMYFTIEQFMQELSCSRQTIINAKKELQKIGLLEEIRQGVNKPNIMYINGSLNTRLQEVQKLDGTNTNITNTNISRLSKQQPATVDVQKSYDMFFEVFPRQRKNMITAQQIKEDVEEFGNELYQFALKQAVNNGASYPSYLDKIFTSWRNQGITTLEQAIEEQRKFDDGKANRFQNGNSSQQKSTNVPDWADKPVEKREPTAEEKARLEELKAQMMSREG